MKAILKIFFVFLLTQKRRENIDIEKSFIRYFVREAKITRIFSLI